MFFLYSKIAEIFLGKPNIGGKEFCELTEGLYFPIHKQLKRKEQRAKKIMLGASSMVALKWSSEKQSCLLFPGLT